MKCQEVGRLQLLEASMVGESTVASKDSYALERACAQAHQKMVCYEIVRIMGFNSNTLQHIV